MLHENIDKYFLASIVESSRDSIISINFEGVITSWNKAAERLYGYPAAEAVGKPLTMLTLPEDLREILANIEKIKHSQSIETFETERVGKNGNHIVLEITLSPVRNEAGEIVGVSTIAREMPNALNRMEREQEKESARLNEISLANAQRIAQIGSWEWNTQNNELSGSDEIYRIFGFTKEQLQDLYQVSFNTIHPDDRQMVRSARRAALEQSIPYLIEYRIIRPDGKERFVCEICEMRSNESGNLLGLIGTLQDITKRKLADRKIEESEERYRIVAETASDVIITINESNSILFVNPAVEKVLGYTPEELLGKDLEMLIPERFRAAHNAGLRRYMQTGEKRIPWNAIEVYALRRDDSEIQIEISFGEYHENNKRLFTAIIRDITSRKMIEAALREAEDKYRTLIESSPAIVYLSEPDPPFSPVYISPNVSRFGYTLEEWFDRPDMWVSLIYEEDRERVLKATEDAIEKGIETDLEYRVVARDGAIYWLHDKGRFVIDAQGNKTGWQGVMLDITKTKELEEQLRQSQKLESVGLLAGGIAHDFNNMLTAINGYSDLTLRKLKAGDPLRRNIEEIKKAGERSAQLTQQLLAFSRRQILHPVVLDLNEVINDTVKMLQRLIGEDIELNTALSHQVGRVKVDPGQLSQIITNLVVNSRDAMPQGGRLTIETKNVFLDPDYPRRHSGVLPGAYVMLAVSDTGSGMSGELKKRIFDPFFTTKKIGQGTGLGLATVYGIVKQSGGSIEVYSEEGTGTTFKVYLPRVVEQITEEEKKETTAELPEGTETILLVEDEELVRTLTKRILEDCGYTVIEAGDGREALKIVEQGAYKFDLLMTDVVMPRMGGRELAEKMTKKLPDLLILFTSGYTDDAVVRHGVIDSNTNFIQKPFTPDILANKIREVLNNS